MQIGNGVGKRLHLTSIRNQSLTSGLKQTAPHATRALAIMHPEISRIRVPSGRGEISRSLWCCNRRSRQLDRSLREENMSFLGRFLAIAMP